MRRSETLVVAASPDDVRAACRLALSPRVWEIERDGTERVLARASAPGFGPIVSRHLANHLEALAAAISR